MLCAIDAVFAAAAVDAVAVLYISDAYSTINFIPVESIIVKNYKDDVWTTIASDVDKPKVKSIVNTSTIIEKFSPNVKRN